MKKVINGRRYDTDQAETCGTIIFELDSGFSDATGTISETLYRKVTGEFFLFGKYDGPSEILEWNLSVNDIDYYDDIGIKPITFEDAQVWAEKYLDADQYEKVFGQIIETAKEHTMTFMLTYSTIEKITRYAEEQNITKSQVIENLVRKEIPDINIGKDSIADIEKSKEE